MSSIDRRSFLRGGLAATALGGVATACTTSSSSSPAAPAGSSGGLIGPHGMQVSVAEGARQGTGRVVSAMLDAAPGMVDLGGVTVNTWSYQGAIPGPEIRARTGDIVEAMLMNRLPGATTVHWHGVALRNDMDGVP